MNAANLIEQAGAEGVNLRLDGGRIGYRGNPEAVRRWLPTLRNHKAELVTALAGREALGYGAAGAECELSVPAGRVADFFTEAARRGCAVLKFELAEEYGCPPMPGGGTFVGRGLTLAEGEAALRARYGDRLVRVWAPMRQRRQAQGPAEREALRALYSVPRRRWFKPDWRNVLREHDLERWNALAEVAR